jgi:hypothetical protein
MSGFLAIAAMRRMPASPSHSSDFVDQPVTTSRLTGVQETWLIFSGSRPSASSHPMFSNVRVPLAEIRHEGGALVAAPPMVKI